MLNFGPAIGRVLVDVRLAVRQDDNSLAVQMPVQALFQTFCSPLSGSILSLVGNTANQFTHVAENGLKFTAFLPSAVKQAANFQTPVIASPFGDEHRHDTRHDGQDRSEEHTSELQS